MVDTGIEEKTVTSTGCTWHDFCLHVEKEGELNIKNTFGKTERMRVPLTEIVKCGGESDFMRKFTLEHCDSKIQSEHQMEILSRQLINYGDELFFFFYKSDGRKIFYFPGR